MTYTLRNGDCLDILPGIPDRSIDMIFADLPYCVTSRNVWDTPIPLDRLWAEYARIIKPNGAILLSCIQPFASNLIVSNPKMYRYEWVWHKTSSTGYLNAKKMPLRAHELILVFYKSPPTYNPQMTHGHERKVSTAQHKRNSINTSNYSRHGLTTYDSTDRYPTDVLRFSTDKQKSSLHPTQKPVALLEYLVLTYTNAGETVLDNCMGSGATIVAAQNTGRNSIGIELYPLPDKPVDRIANPNYFFDAKTRVEATSFNE